MSNLQSKLWVKKYKPNNLSEYIYQNDKQKQIIQSIIDDKIVGHCLFSGIQGTGKTSLSDIIVKELNVLPEDILRINGSDENSIDVIRNKVLNFITVCPNGEFRVVQFEEMDHLSQNAQAGLRVIMEDYVDTAKFILTCNYIHKIIPALKSRCQYQIDFKKPDKLDVAKLLINILIKEKVKFDQDDIFKYIDVCYPDLRKIIQVAQEHTIDNVLISPSTDVDTEDYKFKFLELLEQDDWETIRSIICKQVANDEIESVYRFLYENLDKSPKFKNEKPWQNGQLEIAEYLYKDSLVSDREINLSALFIKLGQL